MAFKRYGGDWQENRGGGANVVAGAFGMAGVVIGSLFTLLGGGPEYMAAGFVFMFISLVVGLALGGRSRVCFNRERLQLHLDSMGDCFRKGDVDGAKEALRKARIYGDIPSAYKQIVNKMEEHS